MSSCRLLSSSSAGAASTLEVCKLQDSVRRPELHAVLAEMMPPGAAIGTLELIDSVLLLGAAHGPALLPPLAALRLIRCRGKPDIAEGSIGAVLRLLLARLPGLQELTVVAADGCSLQPIPPALIQLHSLTRLGLLGHALYDLPPGPYLTGCAARCLRLRLLGGLCLAAPTHHRCLFHAGCVTWTSRAAAWPPCHPCWPPPPPSPPWH